MATSCTMDPNYGEQCTVTGRTNIGTVNYAYDLVGNRTGSGIAYAPGSNRLTSADGYTLGYDLDGNLTSKSKTGYTQTLAWNALGQLSSVTTNGSTTSYAYDGWGRRVKKTTGSTVTGFLWDGDDLYADLDASQNPSAEYAFYPGTATLRTAGAGAARTDRIAAEIPPRTLLRGRQGKS